MPKITPKTDGRFKPLIMNPNPATTDNRRCPVPMFGVSVESRLYSSRLLRLRLSAEERLLLPRSVANMGFISAVPFTRRIFGAGDPVLLHVNREYLYGFHLHSKSSNF